MIDTERIIISKKIRRLTITEFDYNIILLYCCFLKDLKDSNNQKYYEIEKVIKNTLDRRISDIFIKNYIDEAYFISKDTHKKTISEFMLFDSVDILKIIQKTDAIEKFYSLIDDNFKKKTTEFLTRKGGI